MADDSQTTDIRTVADLRKALEKFPDDLPVGISVHGHPWYGPCHRDTHGPMRASRTRLHFGDRTTKDIALLHEGGMPKDRYLPTGVDSLARSFPDDPKRRLAIRVLVHVLLCADRLGARI